MVESDGTVAALAGFCRDAAMRGWHERNGGNVSVRLSDEGAEEAAAEFARMAADAPAACVCAAAVPGAQPSAAPGAQRSAAPAPRSYPLAWPVPELEGVSFLVTATGCFMRNVAEHPAESIGLIRIAEGGAAYEVVAGFADGGRATSELPSHLLVHLERARACGAEGSGTAAPGADVPGVVYHAHTPSLIALSHVVEPDTAAFTRALWSTFTECPMFCPAGVGLVDFLVPGSLELARATAELARCHDIIMWALHGILACGPSLQEVYGLVETVEKAAGIALRTRACAQACGRAPQRGLDAQRLIALDEALGLGLDRSLLA